MAINKDSAVAAEMARVVVDAVTERRRTVLVEGFAEVAAELKEQIDTIETELDARAEDDPVAPAPRIAP